MTILGSRVSRSILVIGGSFSRVMSFLSTLTCEIVPRSQGVSNMSLRGHLHVEIIPNPRDYPSRNDSPPKSKKLSRILILSTPNTSDQILASSASVDVVGRGRHSIKPMTRLENRLLSFSANT
jgi:hypothetical protein